MKRNSVVLLGTLALTVLANSGLAQSFLTDGLMAYYPFNGNANDASGNSFNGAPFDVTLTSDRFGTAGGAYAFNGSDSVVTVGQLASTNLSALTMSAWIKPAVVPSVQGTVISKWAAFASSLADYNLVLFSDMTMELGNGRHGSAQGLVTTNSLVVGQWQHVVATIDPSGMGTILINGVVRAKRSVSPLVAPGTEPVRIGEIVTATGSVVDSFNGSIDDVRLYNRALSETEVQQLYAYESQSHCIPHGSTAVAQVVNGFLVGATITGGGCGYTNAPMVKIIGSGTGATATATLSNGSVTQINITSTGSGYSTNTIIRIASPPFMPWNEIAVSKVKVTMHVIMGKNYIVEASNDMVTWTQVSSQFTAEDEVVVQEFDVEQTGRYFRTTQVP